MEHWNGYLTRGNIEEVAANVQSILDKGTFAAAYTDGRTGGEGRQPILSAGLSLVSVEVKHGENESWMTIADSQNVVRVSTSLNEGDEVDHATTPRLHCSAERVVILHVGDLGLRYHRVYQVAPLS